MPQTRDQPELHFQSASIYISCSPAGAWEHAVLPWLKSTARCAIVNQRPACVVVPHRALAQHFRARLAAAGMSLLGVRFFVPAQLREFLKQATPRVPLREHLRLLLSIAAEEYARNCSRNNKIDNLRIAEAVARDPDELLRAVDNLAAASTDRARFQSAALAEIAERFGEILRRCGCALVAEADRLLLQKAAEIEPRFSNVLITGFDAGHWPLWPLLRAATLLAENATLLLQQPRHEAAELDRIWTSTWEQYLGAANPVAASGLEPDRRRELLLTLPETAAEIAARKENRLGHVHFLLGRNSDEQARAIVALTVAFLNEKKCDRVAILLPGAGALARLVASWLERLGVPHNDAIAHPMRGPFDTEEWRAWIELQQQARVGPLLRFLEHSPTAVAFFAPLSLWKIRDTLQRACGDILINAVDVLREYCHRRNDDPKYSQVAEGLRAIRFLPARATFAQFVKEAHSIFRELNWTERAAEVNRLSRDWSEGFEAEFSREHFLRWLSETFAESSLSRDDCGDHPYARVQLLHYEQAESEAWSHVILAGLNERVWPPTGDESPFLSDDEIAALNRRNTQSSRFGEGQSIAREGSALCVSSRDRRAIALRQLLNIIESTTGQIGVAAELYTQSPREQAVNPSEFFARLFFSARGEALSQRNIARVHEQTRDWLASQDVFAAPGVADVDLAQTVRAYRERRRADSTFGEYEFAFRQDAPPPEQVALSATDAANLFKWPALVWIKTFLRVQADELGTSSWSLATGQWVHRWLAVVGAPRENRFVSRPAAGEIVDRVKAAADTFRTDILSILQACDRTRAPDWWVSGWRNARHLAKNFAAEVAELTGWPRVATEWSLDSPHIIPLDRGDELRVRGRVDLILARDDDAGEFWIVDYKTGEAKPLKSHARELRKQLVEGDGVQICIYALALRPSARNIEVSLLTRDAGLEAQVGLDQIIAHDKIWTEIARMQRTGIFGMKGELRSDFTFTGTYPLATIAIDKDLLREKWERTHRPFARWPNQ
jgi:hypothetical protein